MPKFKFKKLGQEKGEALLIFAPLMTVLAFMNVGDAHPVTNLFGLVELLLAIVFVVRYMCHEAARVYEADKVKRKRWIIILSGLSGLFVMPVMAVLLLAQFALFYRRKMALDKTGLGAVFKSRASTFYIISIVCILINTYINITYTADYIAMYHP